MPTPAAITATPPTAMPMIAPVDSVSVVSAVIGTGPAVDDEDAFPAAPPPVDDDDEEPPPELTGTWHCTPVNCGVQLHCSPLGVPPLKQITCSQNWLPNGGTQTQRLGSVVLVEPPLRQTARLQSLPVKDVPVQSHWTWRLNRNGVPWMQTLQRAACCPAQSSAMQERLFVPYAKKEGVKWSRTTFCKDGRYN